MQFSCVHANDIRVVRANTTANLVWPSNATVKVMTDNRIVAYMKTFMRSCAWWNLVFPTVGFVGSGVSLKNCIAVLCLQGVSDCWYYLNFSFFGYTERFISNHPLSHNQMTELEQQPPTPTPNKLYTMSCAKCSHTWVLRKPNPKTCPNCKNPKYWNPRVRQTKKSKKVTQ